MTGLLHFSIIISLDYGIYCLSSSHHRSSAKDLKPHHFSVVEFLAENGGQYLQSQAKISTLIA
jgi:hypothetical protein